MNKNAMTIILLSILLFACKPEANWNNTDVDITISPKTVSAGFIECDFSTSLDSYYLIGIDSVREDFDPMMNQKQYMMLALDNANLMYLFWRNRLLQEGEFNIAPFSSHSLQYGNITHFFTGLKPDSFYWIYAFNVNPETLTPIGTLKLLTVQTSSKSVVDISFEYRVKGMWDYIYPVDNTGKIYSHFPYVATTRDSLEIAASGLSPKQYFLKWMEYQFDAPAFANVYYGVRAVLNDGYDTYLVFEPQHTYYTCIGGFDGSFNQMAVYKFFWNDDDTEYFFTESDKINVSVQDE